jgi:hypothetical protein
VPKQRPAHFKNGERTSATIRWSRPVPTSGHLAPNTVIAVSIERIEPWLLTAFLTTLLSVFALPPAARAAPFRRLFFSLASIIESRGTSMALDILYRDNLVDRSRVIAKKKVNPAPLLTFTIDNLGSHAVTGCGMPLWAVSLSRSRKRAETRGRRRRQNSQSFLKRRLGKTQNRAVTQHTTDFLRCSWCRRGFTRTVCLSHQARARGSC